MAKKKYTKGKNDPAAYRAIVIGASAGGLEVFSRIFPQFAKNFPLPVIVVQHLHPESDGAMMTLLDDRSAIKIKEADEKEVVQPGKIYIAPANYHLLIERDGSLSLSIDAKVNYCRPSIDVMFESAVDAYGPAVIGILLTGANADGAVGLLKIKNAGGKTIIQDPETAYADTMPRSAMAMHTADYILKPEQIVPTIMQLIQGEP